MSNRDCIRVVRRTRELGRRLQTAEEVRLLEDLARCAGGCRTELVGVRRAAALRHLDDLETEPRRVRPDDLTYLGVRGLGDDDLRAARGVLRDVAGVGRNR